jgi:hypothetical protein
MKAMKTIATTAADRKGDSSLDASLNPVELGSKEIVSWGIAFPRHAAGEHRRASMWRIDATVGTVLGVAGRTPRTSG